MLIIKYRILCLKRLPEVPEYTAIWHDDVILP